MHQDAEGIGQKAAEKLVEIIESRQKEIVEEIIIKPNLYPGETVRRME